MKRSKPLNGSTTGSEGDPVKYVYSGNDPINMSSSGSRTQHQIVNPQHLSIDTQEDALARDLHRLLLDEIHVREDDAGRHSQLSKTLHETISSKRKLFPKVSPIARETTADKKVSEDKKLWLSSEELEVDWINGAIGQGSFGKVYRGHCRGSQVVVKKLKMKDKMAEFENEVATMVNCRNRNVVLFMGICVEPDNQLIVMEYMPKGSLSSLMDLTTKNSKEYPTPSFEERIQMIEDTARGMNWLHGSSILHLDLKLDNLLMDKDKNVKVADFGLSRVKTSQVLVGQLGTPQYTAPEVILKMGFDERADVYSFAIVAYELAFWRKAWSEFVGPHAPMQVMFQVTRENKRPKIEEGCPKSLKVLLEHCWATNPGERPPFSTIIDSKVLNHILVENYISPERNNLGWLLWTHKFLEHRWVKVNDLVHELLHTLNIPEDHPEIKYGLLGFRELVKEENKPDMVSLQRFGALLEAFGPLKEGPYFFATIERCIALEGFQGFMEGNSSTSNILRKEPGAYLIRFSNSPGYFAISVVNKEKQTKHYRVKHRAGQPFTLLLPSSKPSYPSLEELITKQSGDLHLMMPLPGKYLSIFDDIIKTDAPYECENSGLGPKVTPENEPTGLHNFPSPPHALQHSAMTEQWSEAVTAAIGLIPPHISSHFTYMDFHRIFNFPLLVALFIAAIVTRQLDIVRSLGLFVFCIVSFVAATPWDIHLVATGVWGYEEGQVLGTMYGVPYEEYAFFLIQTLVSGLLYINMNTPLYAHGKFSDYHRYPYPPSLRKPVKIIGGLLWLSTGIASVFLLDTGKQYYLRLILSYFCPFISAHWFSAGDLLLKDYLTRWKTVIPIALSTAYYWFADCIAIKLGSWRFSEEHSTGYKILGNLPIEEALFFWITNVLIVQSIFLFERYFITPTSRPTRAHPRVLIKNEEDLYNVVEGRTFSPEKRAKRAEKKVIVIGAGLGGLAVAGRMAKAGYKVEVLEKNEHEGGRCDYYEKEGHRFDIGPSIMLMPQLFEMLFQDLDKDLYRDLNLVKVDPLYNIHFADGTTFLPSSDLTKMKEQLEKIEPGSFQQWMRYIEQASFHYYGSIEHVIGRNFRNILEYFDPRKMQMIFSLRPLRNHWSYVSTFFKSHNLRSLVTFQNMYLGLSPFQAQATYSLMQYTEYTDGIWYPKGGMHEIPRALKRASERLGARYRFDSEVERIVTEGGRAKGVVLKNGQTLDADIIICNADLPFVYDKLLREEKQRKKMESLKYTSSAIMFYWALDKIFPEIQHHNMYLCDNYEEGCRTIFDKHDVPPEPSFYINAPQRSDPSAAPSGQDSIMILVPVGHLAPENDNPKFWKEKQDYCRKFVLNRLKMEGIDIERHIKWEHALTPIEWRDNYNLAKGVTFGLSHEFWQIGFFRPRNKHAKLNNLYFSGASTHPGSGMPLVLLSAKLAAERVFEDEEASTGYY
ncbi:phytoene desaturase [Planoprotostelium fungivorum]|uniref:Phytoene desaturase n=1 Tax=Planoprotostelium fungivorum TaxID=1890364 RepID=A0A2P6NYE5_9EUKA|nr:phytoene desaturase [Planoprotostelium fungivorum]